MICYTYIYIYNIVVSIVYYDTKNQCQWYVTMMMLVIKLVRRWYIILQLTLNVLYYNKMSYFPFNFLVNICISFHWNSSFFSMWSNISNQLHFIEMRNRKRKNDTLQIEIGNNYSTKKKKNLFVFVKCMKYVLIIFMNDWCFFNE